MTINVTRFHDNEALRQQKNLTTQQKKNNSDTREGVVVNNFIKDCPNCELSLNDTRDLLVISDNVKMPARLTEQETPKEKSIIPISGVAVGVMGVIALFTAFIKRNATINSNPERLDRLPTITRNIVLNEETHQILYRMIHNPTPKTILAGSGVLALTAMAFMGKTFFDGYKDIWVKKKEADIQKNLQEKLVSIETQSFSGKIQIIRSMLSEKAKELNRFVTNAKPSDPSKVNKSFGGITFGSAKSNKQEKSGSNWKYFMLGMGTLGSIVGLGYLSMKNLNASKKEISQFMKRAEKSIDRYVANSSADTMDIDKIVLKQLFHEAESSKKEIEESIKKLNWNDKDKEDFTKEALRATAKVNEAMGGDGTDKTTFYSHVDDYRAHFYNYLLNTDNKSFQQLFFGITGLSAIGYGGKLVGDAVKEVQVKKINAETEVNLQNRLVATELRNFKSKKDSAIQPLIDEFYCQVALGKPKEELKTMADNILLEIKNGPPFVYS